ncbi:MAG: response regulator [Planctomycetes bacterium]|nr:response regulator [Planctomycetota bacterium]
MATPSNKKVLVVDDESDARAFVRAILEPQGWQVAEAVNGLDGLKQARALRPDLVVLDVQMPGKGGFELFNDLRGAPETRGAKVIMLTGVAEKTGIRFSAKDMGDYLGEEPDAYVEKPIDPEVFKRTVRDVTGAGA